MNKYLRSMQYWWQGFRYHYVPPSIFPVVLGSMVSWANGDGFSTWYFSIVLITVVVNHIALNMTDDYFDFKHAVDHQQPGEKNPYTGGSGTLTSGLIGPRRMIYVCAILFLFVIISGVYLAVTRGWLVMVFGLIGVLSSIFYTAPPVKLSHHGIGELAMFINFGSVLGLGAYYVQAQNLSWEAFLATLPCGIMLFALIMINEIPDRQEDVQAGKLTLVARYGTAFGLKLYTFGWMLVYLVIIVGIVTMILPIYVVLAFISVPWVIRSIIRGKRYLAEPQKMMSANLDNIKANALTSLGLIGGYAIFGFLNFQYIHHLVFIVMLLGIVYLPAAIPIILPPPHSTT